MVYVVGGNQIPMLRPTLHQTPDLQRHPKLMRQRHSEFHNSVWAKTGLKLDLTSSLPHFLLKGPLSTMIVREVS